jgi:hypothetical protein
MKASLVGKSAHDCEAFFLLDQLIWKIRENTPAPFLVGEAYAGE